jgi:MFS family permease
MYASGPFAGRFADTRSPKPLFVYAFICLFVGYVGIWSIFSSNGKESETPHGGGIVALLVFLSFLTETGGSAGVCSAVNATTRTFPDRAVSFSHNDSSFSVS